MSLSENLSGVDHAGRIVPLCASISHPERDVILVQWRELYDATVFVLGGETLVAIGNGVETFTLKVALKEGEEILGITRDAQARELRINTRVR